MKHILPYFIGIALLFFNDCLAQQTKADTVIDKGIYKSYFSYKLKNPLYVTYSLYRGGGPCDREKEGFNFKVDNCKPCAKNTDYTNSGYERGHLANAEDFAFDCEKEELTFRFYNCVPQTYELNHGSWLHWEDSIRTMSRKQKIFVIAGSIFGKETIGKNKVSVPTHCYKIIINPTTGKPIVCMLFPNDDSGSGKKISLSKLKKMLGYALLPEENL
jgi:endonuclease G